LVNWIDLFSRVYLILIQDCLTTFSNQKAYPGLPLVGLSSSFIYVAIAIVNTRQMA